MRIGGFQKTSLIDFPNLVSAVIFTNGCNFRCPFCFNAKLALGKGKLISEKKILEFLEKRVGLLDGIVITGGEPTMQKDLEKFIGKIKKLGFKVKLDTNGSAPEILKNLLVKRLVDYVAMDYKIPLMPIRHAELVSASSQSSCRTRFGIPRGAGEKTEGEEILKQAIAPLGVQDDIYQASHVMPNKIKKSLKILMKPGVPFELRTTIVPGIHDEFILKKMAEELGGLSFGSARLFDGQAKSIAPAFSTGKTNMVAWFWQNFRPGECLDKKYNKIKPYKKVELKKMLMGAKKVFPKAELRF